jgi:glycosyltransferase involved in cell wall biosynthesis
VDLLPKVAKALLARVPEALFLCVGDGEERPSVEAQAKALGVSEAFRFVGAVPPERVPGYLASADAGIAPFRISGYPPFARYGFFYSPLKIFEYMACGLPVLATDCPELAHVVAEGRTGRLCPEGDVAAMASVLAAWATESGLRRAMGEAARRDAETRFSWQAHAAGVEAILQEVAGARRA